IGRHRSCDVILKGDFCSNLHCRISAKATLDGSEDFDVSCEDLSSNGTYLNRKKIGRGKTVLLSHGDTLEIHKGNYFTFLQTYRRPGQDALLHQDQEVVDAKYQITERILGTGTFAQVKLAICKTTGQRLAAKIIDRQRFGSISVKQRGTDFVQEINIMQSITHPNIVQVTDVIRTPKYLYIFMPLLTGGDLFEYIMHQERLPEAEAKFICFQILHALKYLHERNISHRDVKPENVLLKTNSPYAQVMLTDFGMARVVGKKSFMQTMCGTFQYIAPEVIAVNKSPEDTDESCQGYNKMVDCWSLGVLLYAALSGTLPFSSDDDNNTLLFREIQAGIVTFPSVYWGDISEEARSMVKSLLVVDPRRRATVHDALNHPWIQTDIETLQRLHHNCLLQ
ncbi:kinase-like domain-containing protein, partial [Dimargaris cristalligena]